MEAFQISFENREISVPSPNLLNVYKGPDSMINYFNPDIQPPLPLVELPARLNPFRNDKVRIYAKMITALPAQNVKSLPALNMLLNDPSAAKSTIIEQSSGSTAMSLGIVARVLYNNNDCRPYVSNKVGPSRLKQLRFFGLNVEIFGGPSQPEILDSRGKIRKAHLLGQESEKFTNPGQYENENNWTAHIRWTGPQIWKQLPEINIFCMGMGSTGCVTGTGMYLKQHKPSVAVVGVCFPVEDIIPGPRTLPLVEMSNFPWKETVDAVKIVDSVHAYRLSMSLSREGLICGPSSGMNLQGLFDFLQHAKENGELQKYAEPATGEISCVFICCDLPYQHLDGYFTRLDKEEFPPIINHGLLHVDTDEYNGKWELSTSDAMTMLYGLDWDEHYPSLCSKIPTTNVSTHSPPSPKPTIIDLRSSSDFATGHIPTAINAPLANLTADTPSPFDDVDTLQTQWADLKAQCTEGDVGCALQGRFGPFMMLCWNGETSRLATAVMRAMGVEAYSVRGGMMAIRQR